jgi:hypothetical protein
VKESKKVSEKAERKMAKRLAPEIEAQLHRVGPRGGMIVRWIACVDLLEEDGTRTLFSLTSEGMQPWEFDGIAGGVPDPFDRG